MARADGRSRRRPPARSPKPALYWSEAVLLKEAAIKTQHALDSLTEAEAVCGGEAFGEARGLLQQGPCAKKSAFKALAKIAHFQNGETQDQEKGRVLQKARRALRDVVVLHCISRDDPENQNAFSETVDKVLDDGLLTGFTGSLSDLKAQLVMSFLRGVFHLRSIYHPLKWSTNLHSLWPLPARAIPKILLLIAVRLKIPLPVIVHRVLPFAMYPCVVPPETAEALTPDEPDYHEREVARERVRAPGREGRPPIAPAGG